MLDTERNLRLALPLAAGLSVTTRRIMVSTLSANQLVDLTVVVATLSKLPAQSGAVVWLNERSGRRHKGGTHCRHQKHHCQSYHHDFHIIHLVLLRLGKVLSGKAIPHIPYAPSRVITKCCCGFHSPTQPSCPMSSSCFQLNTSG